MIIKSPLKRLTSVVGSERYQAPEIKQNSTGYDGTKVDIWSSGVILYTLVTGNMPFNDNLSTCSIFSGFKNWISENSEKIASHTVTQFPPFFCCYGPGFQRLGFSNELSTLLVSLLHPDPSFRLSASQALRHPWFHGMAKSRSRSNSLAGKNYQTSDNL